MKTVLIIEDNAAIRESCSEILKLSGYRVYSTDNGKAGIELATKQKPDIILCDITMPELDGYGVLFLLSKSSTTSEIPLIFLTAKTDQIDFKKAIGMGEDDYLVKPFNDMELLNAIEARMDKWQTQKSVFEDQPRPSLDGSSGMQELKELIGGRKIRYIKKKQILFYEGDPPQGLYLIIEGSIKTVKRALDGRQLITGLYQPNDYIGLDTLLLGDAFTETAEATEDTAICLLPREQVLNLLNKYPEVGRQFMKILSHDIHQKEEQLLELAYLSVRKRIAQVLVRLSYKSPSSSLLTISRDDLAELAGVAIETVSRTLSDFKEEGLIEKKGNQIELIDINRISKLKN